MPMKFNTGSFFASLLIMLSANVYASIPEVSCTFQTIESFIQDSVTQPHQHAQKANTWFFWRTAHTVEVSNATQSFGERWISYDQQSVFYQALYHDKKFLLDFQPSDLKILGKQANWEMRTTLFSQSILQQLQQHGSGKFQQYETVRYAGKVENIHYQVDWIPALKLPFRIEKQAGNKIIVTELKEFYPLLESPNKAPSSDNYEDMDYADIGDNESHPIVAQLQKNVGIGYFHPH